MRLVITRSVCLLLLLCGLIVHNCMHGVAFFSDEELAIDSELPLDESEIALRTLPEKCQLIVDFCEKAYADPSNYNEWALLYGLWGHAQLILGQSEVGVEKIERVIDNPKVDPMYRGWACKIAAYWMQAWGRDAEAQDYLQEAVSCGYND